MTDDMELDLGLGQLVPIDQGGTIEERFAAFHELNPWVYRKELFDDAPSVLPAKPGRDAVVAYLRVVRRAYL